MTDNCSFCTTSGLVMTIIRYQEVVCIVDDTICRLVVTIECVTVVNCVAVIVCSLSHALGVDSFTAADSLGIAVEMHNTLIKNMASRETTPLNAISVARLISELQLCISTAYETPVLERE